MVDLLDCTFIIPIRIESEDRYHNAKAILGYLNHHFKTNIKIYEVFSSTSNLDFLPSLTNLNLHYKYELLPDNEPFHRTKYLNIMLDDTTTDIVSNYDADVLLPVDVYVDVVNHLKLKKSDFVYPFILGEGQKKLHYSKWYEDRNKDLLYWSMIRFLETFNIKFLDDEDTFISESLSSYGHCFFARTQSYKSAFGENEDFISYGPEDVERFHRFEKLGFKVDWWSNHVYHLEHFRTNDSCKDNPFFEKNNQLYKNLINMDKQELIDYYTKKSKF